MKLALFFTATLSVLSTNGSNKPDESEGRRRILLLHHLVGRHYIKTHLSPDRDSSITIISAQEARTRCQQSLGLAEYHLVRNSGEFLEERLKTSDSLNNVTLDDVNDFYNIRGSTDYVSDITAIKDLTDLYVTGGLLMSRLKLNIIKCAKKENKGDVWFIANRNPGGDSTPVYILDTYEHFPTTFFWGMIDYVADIVFDEGLNNLRELEMKFVNSQKKNDRAINAPKKNICEVGGAERFSMCSTMHWGWYGIGLQYGTNAFINQIQEDQGDCIEAPKFTFTKIDPVVFGGNEYNTVELLECAVNHEKDSPEFYVTGDQEVHGGAYVIVRSNDEYFVSVRMHNISALKRIFET